MSDVRTSRARRTMVLTVGLVLQGLLALAACEENSTEPSAGAVSVSASGMPTSIIQGENGAATITIVRTDPFTETVALTLEGAPAGLTAVFAPALLASGTTTSTLTLSPAVSLAAGTYPLTVRATGAGVPDATTSISLVVAQRGTIALTLSNVPASIAQGQSGTATITLARSGPFMGAVALTLEGAPAGLTGTFAPATIASGDATSTLTLAPDASVAPGTYAMTVRGTGTNVADVTAPLSIVVSPAPAPAIALAVSPDALSVAQGATGTSTATITRSGGFAGAVDLSVAGAPTGMTVTIDPPSVPGNATTATISVSPDATVTPGDYTLTIQGTGTGVTAQSTTLAVTVTGVPTSATYAFCADNAPVWLAVQDGNGPWTRVTPVATNTYTFQFTSGRGGVAYVTSASGSTDVTVLYATSAELAGTGGTNTVECTTPAGKTVNGSVAGLGPSTPTVSDFATIVLGPSTASATEAMPTFQLTNVPNGPHDLIASRSTFTFSGTDFTSVVNRIIIRRALDPPNGSTLPVLDFGSAESFAPATANVTIGNLGTDQALTSTALSTANGSSAAFSFTSASAAATQPYYGVPDAQLIAGDIHVLSVIATPTGPSPTTSRFASLYFRSVTDRTVTLGSVLGVPTITREAAAPYLRLRAQLPLQAEYNSAGGVSYTQGTSPSTTWSVLMTGAYAGGAAYDLIIPDLSGAAGWNNAWGLVPGVSTEYSVFEIGGTFNQFFPGRVPVEGATSVFATRSGTIASP